MPDGRFPEGLQLCSRPLLTQPRPGGRPTVTKTSSGCQSGAIKYGTLWAGFLPTSLESAPGREAISSRGDKDNPSVLSA